MICSCWKAAYTIDASFPIALNAERQLQFREWHSSPHFRRVRDERRDEEAQVENSTLDNSYS